MSERHGRTDRDVRRRALGQNFLADRALVRELLAGFDIRSDDLVVDVGAGSGALTLPIADLGASVWAVEPDHAWADVLEEAVHVAGASARVRVIRTGIERLRLPRVPYRVIANPPFGLTTRVLELLLDDPERGPERADLVLQRDVAIKHAASPARALRSAAWAPWWRFELGPSIDRTAFRPRPRVDARVLTAVRRSPPMLPTRLAPDFLETLRPAWTRPVPSAGRQPGTEPRAARIRS